MSDKKEYRKKIATLLENALIELKAELGEKKFGKRVEKAAKLLAEGLDGEKHEEPAKKEKPVAEKAPKPEKAAKPKKAAAPKAKKVAGVKKAVAKKKTAPGK